MQLAKLWCSWAKLLCSWAKLWWNWANSHCCNWPKLINHIANQVLPNGSANGLLRPLMRASSSSGSQRADYGCFGTKMIFSINK